MPEAPRPGGMHPQTAIAMGQLLQRLAGNPKTRDRTLSMVKEIDPTYRLPADVAIADLERRQDAKLKENRDANNKAARENRYANQRKELVGTHGEDIVKAIEAGPLKKYPHLELADAAKLYAADTSPVTVREREQREQGRSRHWEFPNIPGLLENPEKAAADMAYSVIDELRGRA